MRNTGYFGLFIVSVKEKEQIEAFYHPYLNKLLPTLLVVGQIEVPNRLVEVEGSLKQLFEVTEVKLVKNFSIKKQFFHKNIIMGLQDDQISSLPRV